MHAAEIRDSGTLLGTVLDDFAILTRDVHRAISGRLFGLLGRRALPVKLSHDAISGLVYGCVRAGVRYGPMVAGIAVAPLQATDVSVHERPGARATLSAINGAIGSRVATAAPALATPMALRTGDGPLRRRVDLLIADLVAPTGRVVAFLHGLCESDSSWWMGAEKRWGDPSTSYGSKLQQEAGWTPLYATYNSGLHISANGLELAGLLDELVQSWPVPVSELALVGHSMGALVVRSACHQAVEAGHSWIEPLRNVVMLGAPHTGAPLERVVNAGMHLLARVPETRPVATLLNQRSVGIKDLRYGSLLEADWLGIDPDERLRDRCSPVPLLPNTNYYAVAATLTRRHDSPLAPILGDLLVQWTSATGQHPVRRIPLREDGCYHIGRAAHLHLLNRPAIYAQLRNWLA